MNCFGGRFVVCVAVLMVVSASALAQDRCCRRVSKSCQRAGEIRRCENHDAACFSTGATCAPAATYCRPSATTCCSETVRPNHAAGVAPTTDQLPQPQFHLQLHLPPFPDFNSPESRYWQNLRNKANEIQYGR